MFVKMMLFAVLATAAEKHASVGPDGKPRNPVDGGRYLWDTKLLGKPKFAPFAYPSNWVFSVYNALEHRGFPKLRELLVKYGLAEQLFHLVWKYLVLLMGEIHPLIMQMVSIIIRHGSVQDRHNLNEIVTEGVHVKFGDNWWFTGKPGRLRLEVPEWITDPLWRWVINPVLGWILFFRTNKVSAFAHKKIDESIEQFLIYEFNYAGEQITKMYNGFRKLAKPFAEKHGFAKATTWQTVEAPATESSRAQPRSTKLNVTAAPEIIQRVPYAVPVPSHGNNRFPWGGICIALGIILLFSCCGHLYQCMLLGDTEDQRRTLIRRNKANRRKEKEDAPEADSRSSVESVDVENPRRSRRSRSRSGAPRFRSESRNSRSGRSRSRSMRAKSPSHSNAED